MRVDQVKIQKLQMNEFEEKILECKDITRIISEVVQLENYIFRKDLPPPEPVKAQDQQALQDDALNDLETSFGLLERIGKEIHDIRHTAISKILQQRESKLVRKIRGQFEVNLTTFFRKFGVLHAIA